MAVVVVKLERLTDSRYLPPATEERAMTALDQSGSKLIGDKEMGDNVLKFPPGTLADDHAFIVDMARFADGLLSEKQIKKKYRFDAATWEKLGNNDALVEKIEEEKARRIRRGETARERAQALYAGAPTVLGNIMNDGTASPRYRIESAKELRVCAANGPESVPAADRFQIVINLGADQVLKFDKPIAIGPDDPNPPNEDDTTQELLPFVATKKTDDNNGEPV